MPSPVFIIGAQRSGTTLLRLMLNAHPEIAIPEEGGFWKPLLRICESNVERQIEGRELQRYIEYIDKDPQFRLWGMEADDLFEDVREKAVTLAELMSFVYVRYAEQQGKSIWGDKTPSFFRMIDILNKLFPNARFVHIVRDGRDLYLSWRRIDPTKRNISVTALEWAYKVRQAQQAMKKMMPEKWLEVRYEDLVRDPKGKLMEVCGFLSIDYKPGMLEYWKTSDSFIGKHHSKLIFKPVSSESVGKWKRKLSKKENRKFELVAGRMLASRGYELASDGSASLGVIGEVIVELIWGLPLGSVQVFIIALSQYLSAKYGIVIMEPKVGSAPSMSKEKR